MHIDVAVENDGKMMQQLYELFFSWATDDDVPPVDEAAIALENMTEEQKIAKFEQ